VAAVADTTSPVGPGTALTVAIEGFLNHLQALQAARATVVAYRSDLTQVSALMADDPAALRVADLTVARLEAGFAGYAQGRSPSTVTRAWSCWNKFCAQLTQLGALPGNPMDAVGHTREPHGTPDAGTEADPHR
jgi:site-specific recombinase XerC